MNRAQFAIRQTVLLIAATASVSCSTAENSADTTLTSSDDWFTTGRGFSETHHSSLAQINIDNVSELGFAWSYDTGTRRGLEATPVVIDGILFTSGTWGKVYALDAKTGEQKWRFDPGVDGQVARDTCCDVVNRGVAVWRGKVYVAALDGRLFALDAKSGEELWVVDTIDDHSRRYTSTGAPRIAGDVVVIGNSGAEYDARGYISAYAVTDGELRWRFFTVPGSPNLPYEHSELEMAATTWDPNSLWEVGGGGTVWDAMAYDPELNLLYVGTGNAAPYPISARSPAGGDNLFLSSILAINPDSGKLVWYYQTTPGDSWDYTATQNLILADMMIDGAERQIIMQAPKNGFFYILDRTDGELLSAAPYVPVNWATHVDLTTGRPAVTEQANYFKVPKWMWPTDAGGHGWRPMALNPDTGLVYIPAWEYASMRVNLFPDGYEFQEGHFNTGHTNFPPDSDGAIDFFAQTLPYSPEYLKEILHSTEVPPQRELLRAWDPILQKTAWEVENRGMADGSGILSTSGGLVFQGHSTGELTVYNSKTGDLLHTVDTGTGMMAAPMTYLVDGEQYVAVMGGLGGASFWVMPEYSAAYSRGNAGRIMVFKLGGGEFPKPKLVSESPFPLPPEYTASDESLERGLKVYLDHCLACHANYDHSLNPDLRRLGMDKHKIFREIVMEGALVPLGMPRFDDVLTDTELSDVQAYLIKIAWEAFDAQTNQQKD